jgi:hypothetical protein
MSDYITHTEFDAKLQEARSTTDDDARLKLYGEAEEMALTDIPAIPLYLFLQNDWKIVPQSADHVLNVTGGILETSDGSDPFVDPAGSYKIRINRQSPGIAIGYAAGSAVLPTDITAIASATLAAARVTPIHSNLEQILGDPFDGAGTEANPWGPV